MAASAYYSSNGHVLPRIYGRFPYYIHRHLKVAVQDETPPPEETFNILDEEGNVITGEGGEHILQENAP